LILVSDISIYIESGMEEVRFGIKLRQSWKTLRSFPIIPVVILSIIVFIAIFANFITPYPPDEMSLKDRLTPPFFVSGGSTSHILGTDILGRDILSRIIFGARISLSVALLVISISSVTGTILGMVAGYLGGRIDAVLMRVTDAALAFPALLIALLLGVSLGPSFFTVVLALSALGWAPYARMIRGEIIKLREEDFVAQARVIGSSSIRIMIKHIFPNVVNTLVVLMTMSVGLVILVEASLSFLGAGIPPPTPSWGSMVADGRNLFNRAWWISLFPSLAIGLVVLSGNLLGDWLRDKMDPKLRQL
jgi:peptide/nickel transport system permease protein